MGNNCSSLQMTDSFYGQHYVCLSVFTGSHVDRYARFLVIIYPRYGRFNCSGLGIYIVILYLALDHPIYYKYKHY